MFYYLLVAVATGGLFLTVFKPLLKESIKGDVWIMCLWGFMASVLWPLTWIMLMYNVIVRYQYRD